LSEIFETQANTEQPFSAPCEIIEICLS